MPRRHQVVSLRTVFLALQNAMLSKLGLAHEAIRHPGTKGDVTEDSWIGLFNDYLPWRYRAAKAFVLDSRDRLSQQIDVVIYDKQYSPLLLSLDGATYVPAESVYAVFEAKPSLSRANILYAGEKVESVRSLHRTSVAITHAGGIFAPPKPKRILGGIVSTNAEWATAAIARHWSTINADVPARRRLDFGCALSQVALWYEGTKLVASDQDDVLISFFLNLLARLQRVGTVPALDYSAYASAVGRARSSRK